MAGVISDKTDKVSQFASGVGTANADRLVVTGLDEQGQMFRETAPILSLQGRDCAFRSKFRPEVSSWVLIEFDFSNRGKGSKEAPVQGQVKSVQGEGVTTNLYQVYVELEAAQEFSITSRVTPQATSKIAPPSVAPPVKLQPPVTMKAEPLAEALSAAPQFKPVERNPSFDDVEKQQANATTISAPRVSSSVSVPPASAPLDRATMQSEVSLEVERQLKGQFSELRDALRKELQQMADGIGSSGMEQTVRQVIENQIASSYQAAIQTLNGDIVYQIVTKVTGHAELRAAIERMAKTILEEQSASSRNSAIQAQENLILKIADFKQSAEFTIADFEDRIRTSRDGATAVAERAEALEKEVTDAALRLQKAAEQLKHSAQATVEQFEAHVTSQLNSFSAQFGNQLEIVAKEKVGQFMAELEQSVASPAQTANQVLEKISAGLQLARGAARMQEEQLERLSRSAAASFEKEIKAVMIRLAGTIQSG